MVEIIQALTNSNSLILIKNNVRPKQQKPVDVNCTLFWFNLNAYRKTKYNALKSFFCQRKLHLFIKYLG